MRSKRVLRYYCEHCPKSGCNGGHIEKHEKVCFNNPGRECPLCEQAKLEQPPIAELVALMQSAGLEAVKARANGCPACVVAAIQQDRTARGVKRNDMSEGEYVDYDYRVERDRFFHERIAPHMEL